MPAGPSYVYGGQWAGREARVQRQGPRGPRLRVNESTQSRTACALGSHYWPVLSSQKASLPKFGSPSLTHSHY
jgi:hypothetical protein